MLVKNILVKNLYVSDIYTGFSTVIISEESRMDNPLDAKGGPSPVSEIACVCMCLCLEQTGENAEFC